MARSGATPLVVADGPRVLGVIELHDIVKDGIREHCAALRRMGIKTIMVTGDNGLTATAIAVEVGVDDFLAEATPERKRELIRRCQKEGHRVAMCGDGTNDAPALAQADVAVVMNSGTQLAKEAANLVVLDSNPTKFIAVVETGKRMLTARRSLTTFSAAADLAKYFAIIPVAFAMTYPALNALNVMRFTSPRSAILSAVIFNALIIVPLLLLAVQGVKARAEKHSGRGGRAHGARGTCLRTNFGSRPSALRQLRAAKTIVLKAASRFIESRFPCGAAMGIWRSASTMAIRGDWIHRCVSKARRAARIRIMSTKNSGMRIRVAKEIRDAFVQACHARKKPASEVLRDFMRSFTEEQERGQADLFPIIEDGRS